MDNRPIGVFDSGVGGLTVVKQLMKVLKNESIVYFGDTARVPYGNKSKETVTRFSRQDVRFLLSKNVKAVVIACNTASSNSLDELKAEFDVPIFGVVEPGAKEAIKATKNKKIGIIGTAATVRSGQYRRLITEDCPDAEVYEKACPLFVPLAEDGWTDNEIAYKTASIYLEDLIKKGVDCVVLGCTHYPLLKQCIGETVGDAIKLVDPAKEAALEVKRFLEANDGLVDEKSEPEHIFYVSDKTDIFETMCQKALNKIYVPEEIDIEEY